MVWLLSGLAHVVKIKRKGWTSFIRSSSGYSYCTHTLFAGLALTDVLQGDGIVPHSTSSNNKKKHRLGHDDEEARIQALRVSLPVSTIQYTITGRVTCP